MRKFALAATAVAALSVGLQTPAFAAPGAPTDVAVSWSEGKVHLTWKDTDASNAVWVENVDTHEQYHNVSLPPDGANEVLLSVGDFKPADRVQFVIKALGPDGASEPVASPVFDTRRPAVPALQDANLATNLTTSLTWTLGAVADQTPSDPLDVPGDGTVRANVDLPGTATAFYDFAAGATSGVVPAQARPTAIKLSAVNEWGQSAQGTKTVRLGTLSAAITVPSKAVYSARLGIKSTVDLFTSEGREERASDVKVELQARAKTTDAWKTYGRYTGNTTAAFDTGIASLGNRQYRLLLPARKVVSANVIALTPPTSTSAKSSTTYVKFASGGFSPSVGRPGTRWTFSSKILPAVTVKARVQYWDWDNQVWVNDNLIQFTKGSYVERSGPDYELGTIRIRVVVPTVVVNGLTVNASASSAYSQTIR